MKISFSFPNYKASRLIGLLIFLLSFASLGAETVLFKSGEKVYGTVIDQSTDSVVLLRENKRQTVPKSQILKIIFKDIKDEAELGKIFEAEKKKLNKEGKKTEKEEQLDTLMLEQMIKENSYKVVQKRLALIEKYIDERDGGWEEYISAKRNPWEPVWKSAILPGWGLSTMRHENYATTYQVLIGLSVIVAIGGSQASTVQGNKAENKLSKILFEEPNIHQQILSSGVPGASLLVSKMQADSISEMNTAKNREHQYHSYSQNGLGLAIGLYIAQLAQSYFLGKTWAVQNIIQTPSGESVSPGLNFKSTYGPLAAGGGGSLWEYRTDLRYVSTF
ncbi:LA_0442/LA_0875 N-terminal domain-containing protein [Leptospira wolffii]|uniref:LA_0442/LA_0875 N-terminal domain-containing protein n=1 Tax=Leptospira wolffii TaxID=409998 RepID=A0ABV5BMK8_9LEPT|nr:hypothetical protein [Leptospira wolffii]TGK56063.1 hypothetical protein EHQ32_16760 [Leptospira wolffii]TGK72109.1 hypothetical protein EHQ35_12195 [Leptospira wolffii]TGK73774.1 hypothetical protein EHQ27_06825 [Leptospira wolffii]TGL27686.1 hypothetical protein EHQ57_15020 [Leptospira wolffii]TGL54779.1 hypothetical protein EHQ61_02000 [Leptospira wolffii]